MDQKNKSEEEREGARHIAEIMYAALHRLPKKNKRTR
jgi:hypothetical protein